MRAIVWVLGWLFLFVFIIVYSIAASELEGLKIVFILGLVYAIFLDFWKK